MRFNICNFIWNSFRFNEYSKKFKEIVAYYCRIQEFYFLQ